MRIPQQQILEQGHKAYAFLRSAAFSGEFRLIQSFSRLFRLGGQLPVPELPASFRPFLMSDIDDLYSRDARLFQDGIAPWKLLIPESPLKHTQRLARIVLSGVGMSRLRAERKTTMDSAPEHLPDYYRRHFHWQQGGYLTEASAQLYDHQVEILFKGTGAAMRRLVLRPLHEYLQANPGPKKILEVGAGTGLLASEVAHAFPEQALTVSELSPQYLQQAKARLQSAARVDFIQAQAEDLPFKDASYDILYSAFVFHELPRAVREQALREFHRVLKPGGKLIILDSIQASDVPEYAWALERFPQDYHEPFYKDYSLWPLDQALATANFTTVTSGRGFFTKWVEGSRP